MIQLQSVTRSFTAPGAEQIKALDAVSVAVEQGELLTVTGPSGSGKSTLLYTIGAMLRPSQGKVLVGGADVYALSAAERARLRRTRIGFVFQTFNLIPFLDCTKNVALPAILDGQPRDESQRAAIRLLERLHLGHRLRHRPGRLSVGERQRVALARSIVNHPEVLLADEPTGNLDPQNAEEVMALLLELSAKGLTIVMVTHDPQLAGQGTRTVRLCAGSLAEVAGAAVPSRSAA